MELTMDERMDMFKGYLNKTTMSHKKYQYDGVRWCLINELNRAPLCNVRGGFIADEMGLGKTIMMIGLIYSNFMKRTLIIVPPILIEQWYLQIYKTTGHKPLMYHGNNKKYISYEMLTSSCIVLSTYGTIVQPNILLHHIKWNRLIFDEAHHLRNSNTKCYAKAKLLSSKIRWLVSGTPIQNKKQDFYSLCAFIGLKASFYTEKTNLTLLANSFILKRTKAQVGIQISDIQFNNSIVQWSNKKEMLLAEEIHSALSFSNVNSNNAGNLINKFRIKGHLTMLLRAKQSCIYPKLLMNLLTDPSLKEYREAINSSSKLDAVINAVVQNKDNGCGKIIFCHFHQEMNEIAERLRNKGIVNIAIIDGRISNITRNNILANKNDILILQIQTGCEGLNLQENYSEIYFTFPHWNPSVEAQAIARCHRIGQTKTVYVNTFEMSSFDGREDNIVSTTIDKHVNNIQDNKRCIINSILH